MVITDIKLASWLKKDLEFCFLFIWQEHLHSKSSGAWFCVRVSITVLFWQKVYGARSANISRVGCERYSRLIKKTLARRKSIVAVHLLGLNKLYSLF